jgi:hypothetical protein
MAPSGRRRRCPATHSGNCSLADPVTTVVSLYVPNNRQIRTLIIVVLLQQFTVSISLPRAGCCSVSLPVQTQCHMVARPEP